MNVEEFKERLWTMACDFSISVYEIENFIRYQLKKNRFVVIGWKYFNLYCRASINDGDILFTTVDRCSFNPKADNIVLQRCNYEKQQVFYAAVPMDSEVACSATAQSEVAFERLVKKHGIMWHYITLSQWKPERPLNLFVFPLSKRSLEQNRDFQKGLEDWNNKIKNLVSDKDAVEKYTSLLQYFSDVFCKDDDCKENWYRISAAFYNCLMRFSREDKLDIDGIVYPSTNTDSGGTNIVLNKELYTDRVIKCVYVQTTLFLRDQKDPQKITFIPASNGVIPDSSGNFKFSKILRVNHDGSLYTESLS
jgi:hypothetical protein